MQSLNAQCVASQEQAKIERTKQVAQRKYQQFEQQRKREKQLKRHHMNENGLTLSVFANPSNQPTTFKLDNDRKQSVLKTQSNQQATKPKVGPRHVGFQLKSFNQENEKLMDEQLNVDKSLFAINSLTNNLSNDSSDIKDATYAPVEVNIVEKLNVSLDCDGIIQKFDVKGDLEIVINQPEAGSCMFEIVKPKKIKGFGKINYRGHPRMDTVALKKNVLMLKDASKAFKIGRDAKTSILKWRMSCKDEEMIPICLMFWPEASDNEVNVSVTYQIDKDDTQLNNVIVTLPTPTSESPDVAQCDGEYTFHQGEKFRLLIFYVCCC